jgi:hypothetical protein
MGLQECVGSCPVAALCEPRKHPADLPSALTERRYSTQAESMIGFQLELLYPLAKMCYAIFWYAYRPVGRLSRKPVTKARLPLRNRRRRRDQTSTRGKGAYTYAQDRSADSLGMLGA